MGKEVGSLQFSMIGRWKTNPESYPTVEELEVWFSEVWRLNEEMKLAALNEDLLFLEFNSPEKAKWVYESGRRRFRGGVLQLEWWSPESGCIRSKGSVQEAWIRVVGLPLHLWTTEIFRKIGDVCGGFVAVDEVTKMKKEVKWARLLIKLSGKVRPSAVNILEGPRAYELQIWWEIPPWVTGVFPVVSRFEGKNPKEEDEEGACAAERVGRPCQSCNDVGQNEQGGGTKKEKGPGLRGAEVVSPVSGALMRCSGGAYVGGLCEGKKIFEADGPRHVRSKSPIVQRVGAHKIAGGNKRKMQSGVSAGTICEADGPRHVRSKSPVVQRVGAHKTAGGNKRLGGFFGSVSFGRRGGAYVTALGVGKVNQSGPSTGAYAEIMGPSLERSKSPIVPRTGAHKTEAGTNRPGGLVGPTATGPKQVGSQKGLKTFKPGFRGKRGLVIGPKGGISSPKEEKRLEVGGSPSGEVCSLADPACLCVRGPYPKGQEGRFGLGETSGFESCWEVGMGAVATACSSTGISHQDHEEVRGSAACSFALVEVASESPEEFEPEALCILANGSRLETVPSGDFSPPIFSVFGRPLLSGDSSGLGDVHEYEALGEMEPLRVVSVDGREWGKGLAVAPTEGGQAVGGLGSLREESSKVSPDCTGYNSWEDSCLIKFSEYLRVTTAGFEEEILESLRKMEIQQQGDKRKGHPIETRRERELRKLECTINYNGKGQTRGGRDRGNFLLKLK